MHINRQLPNLNRLNCISVIGGKPKTAMIV